MIQITLPTFVILYTIDPFIIKYSVKQNLSAIKPVYDIYYDASMVYVVTEMYESI
jgi:hypothetical protein